MYGIARLVGPPPSAPMRDSTPTVEVQLYHQGIAASTRYIYVHLRGTTTATKYNDYTFTPTRYIYSVDLRGTVHIQLRCTSTPTRNIYSTSLRYICIYEILLHPRGTSASTRCSIIFLELLKNKIPDAQVGMYIGLYVGDFRPRHLLFRYRNKICRTKSFHSNIGRVPIFQYRESSDIDISFHFDIGRNQYRIFRYLKLINHSQMTQVKFYV
jgi:hypothetical protein